MCRGPAGGFGPIGPATLMGKDAGDFARKIRVFLDDKNAGFVSGATEGAGQFAQEHVLIQRF